MNSGAVGRNGIACRNPAGVLALRGQARADEPGPRLAPPQGARHVERAVRAGQRGTAHQRGLDRGQPRLVVAGEVQAQVIVVDHGQLEVRQRRRDRDRRGDVQRVREIRLAPPGGEQQPGGRPGVGALECAQRRLEDAGAGRRRVPVDVEEQQPVVQRRDRVAVLVAGEHGVPGVLPRGQAGRLGAERHRRDRRGARAARCGGAAGVHRPVDRDPGRRRGARARHRAGAEQEPAPGQRRQRAAQHRHPAHDAGVAAQWKVKVTWCGVSHTFWYSTWRADTGGETSRVSL